MGSRNHVTEGGPESQTTAPAGKKHFWLWARRVPAHCKVSRLSESRQAAAMRHVSPLLWPSVFKYAPPQGRLHVLLQPRHHTVRMGLHLGAWLRPGLTALRVLNVLEYNRTQRPPANGRSAGPAIRHTTLHHRSPAGRKCVPRLHQDRSVRWLLCTKLQHSPALIDYSGPRRLA